MTHTEYRNMRTTQIANGLAGMHDAIVRQRARVVTHEKTLMPLAAPLWRYTVTQGRGAGASDLPTGEQLSMGLKQASDERLTLT